MAFSVVIFKTSLQKVPFYLLPYFVLVKDTSMIVGSSMVKIDMVSYLYLILFYFFNIEQQTLHILMLYVVI